MRNNDSPLYADLYAFRMAEGWFRCGMAERRGIFEIFFRRLPRGERYAVFAGAEGLGTAARRLSFSREDLAYLRECEGFGEDFLSWLGALRFRGSISALAEGSLIFPGEPVAILDASLPEVAILEAALLSSVGHPTRVATLSSRLASLAGDRPIVEMGARRAHGRDAALLGARAAYLGGCAATTLTEAGARYGIPTLGTMSHAWVSSFPDEDAAFKAHLKQNPRGATLLLDTYDTLRRGLPAAIRAITESGAREVSVRLDSGDFAELSVRVRSALDAAGLRDVRIMVSGSLDEERISSLRSSPVDCYGIGGRLITGGRHSVPDFVCKPVALQGERGEMIARVKLSDDPGKATLPGEKRLYRLYDGGGHPIADLLTLAEEDPPREGVSLGARRPFACKEIRVRAERVEPLHRPLLAKGESVGPSGGVEEARRLCRASLAAFPPSDEAYPLLLSPRLSRLAETMGCFGARDPAR